MRTMTRKIVSIPILTALLFSGAVAAQHHGYQGHEGHGKPQDTAKASKRNGDSYPFDTCPISGKKLGAMGDPVVKLYEGREVRFCCGGCRPKFEKDLKRSFAKLEARITADQAALYPLETSLVTGKDLPEHPAEFVWGNRLIRLGSEKERAEFDKSPAKFVASLDAAVIAAQGKDYPLQECPVSGERYGDMGKPVDLVIAGRLVRLCCEGCTGDVEKAPAKFVALVDKAMKAKEGKKADDHGKGKEHDGHKG